MYILSIWSCLFLLKSQKRNVVRKILTFCLKYLGLCIPPPPLASCFLSNMKLASFGRNPVISRVGLITNKGGLTLLHINPDGSGHLATAPMCPKHSTTGPLSPQQQNKNRGLSPHYQRGKACVALSDFTKRWCRSSTFTFLANKPVSHCWWFHGVRVHRKRRSASVPHPVGKASRCL